jgi:hypothetical protein
MQPLAQIAPELAETVGSAQIKIGDLFGPMIMGNLVHTSTVMLRKSKLEGIGEFDTQYRRGGEDYDFHLRTLREGPVGLLDLPTIRYRAGSEDGITHHSNNVYIARAFLQAISTAVARDGSRLRGHRRMIKNTFASAHAWLAEECLRVNRRAEGLTHLWHSIRIKPRTMRNYLLVGAAVLPQSFVKGGLRAFRRLRA